MNKEWDDGFTAGFEFATQHYDPQTGTQDAPFPESFIHRAGSFNCGFGEGLISGRSDKIQKAFGKFKSLHWENGKPVIER